MKYVFTILLFTVNLSVGIGQITPDSIVQQFFTNYEAVGSSIALDSLYASNPWMSRAGEAIANLKNQMDDLTEDYVGKYHSYELITQKKVSESFVLRSYLVKFDRQPLRFTFQFYKPQNEWRVHSFKFDGKLGEEMEESARIYYLD